MPAYRMLFGLINNNKLRYVLQPIATEMILLVDNTPELHTGLDLHEAVVWMTECRQPQQTH